MLAKNAMNNNFYDTDGVDTFINKSPKDRDRFRRKYTTTHLRELQIALLDILITVARLCEKHNIPYWLDSGTLLGAIRHKGFIPWDDDIDICMRREDMARFEEIAINELPPHLFLQSPRSEPQLKLPFCKIRNINSFFVEYKDDFSRNYAKGIYIDIFPMETWPSFSPHFSRFLSRGYCRANAILRSQHYYSLRSCAELAYFGFKRFLCKFLWLFCGFFTKKNKYYSNTIECSGNGNRHLITSIFPTSRVIFEGESFSAPANPDRYLRDLFGEYHQLPPEKDRHGHAVFFSTNLNEKAEEKHSAEHVNN